MRIYTNAIATYLDQLGIESVPVKICLRQHFDSVFATVLNSVVASKVAIIHFHASSNSDAVFVVRRGRTGARKDLTHEVHDSVTSSSKHTNYLEFFRRIIVVGPRFR